MLSVSCPRIAQVLLSDFRNYTSLSLSPKKGFVALVGDNGAGKTNILEALSLFVQGRGLRRSELADMVRQPQKQPLLPDSVSSNSKDLAYPTSLSQGFSIALVLESEHGETRLGTGALRSRDTTKGWQRIHRIDGVSVSSTTAFAEYMRVLWLTPDMDGLFRGTAGERRRFLDRLVLAIDCEHGTRVNALERALRSRNRILEENPDQLRWLDAVEREISELGIAVALARKEVVDRLSSLIEQTREDTSPFPFAILDLKGDVDTLVCEGAAVDMEERFQALLRQNRMRDKAAGRTLFGPQTTDLVVRHGPKDIAAEQASTGEQKALLTGIILAQAQLIKIMSGIAPFVLLDEIAAHLDPRRREALFLKLEAFSGQVWATGADRHFFNEFVSRADIFEVKNNALYPLC